jgi:hypothetical protein
MSASANCPTVSAVPHRRRRRCHAFSSLAIAPHIRRRDDLILIGLDGSPSTGVRFTSSNPEWGGSPPPVAWDRVMATLP